MKNETKLGLVFIGILLTIFVALLMKRLARPGNAVLAGARQPANAVNDPTSSKLARQPGPPTLVTPKAQSGKPPESVAAEPSGNRAEKHSQPAKPSRPVAQDPPRSSSTASNDPAPSLIATPLPVTEVGDRYANKPRDPFDGASASPSISNGAQPYRSGYADTNENRRDPSRPEPEPRRGRNPILAPAQVPVTAIRPSANRIVANRVNRRTDIRRRHGRPTCIRFRPTNRPSRNAIRQPTSRLPRPARLPLQAASSATATSTACSPTTAFGRSAKRPTARAHSSRPCTSTIARRIRKLTK